MRLSSLAPVGLLLVALTAAADTAVYDLDPKTATEITAAIRSVLSAQCQQGGPNGNNPHACHAELLSTGQLLVAAPESAQTQVAAALKAIAARNAAATPRVTLQYWVLYGEPRKADARDPALKQLDSVLQQLERTHGELGFTILDSTTLMTQSGSRANTEGGALQVEQRVRANADSASVEINMSFSPQPPDARASAGVDAAVEAVAAALAVAQRLNVEVTIRQGEYLVLGERTAAAPENSGRLFYVVHWPQGQ